MMGLSDVKPWLVKLLLMLWGLQILWLAWHFGPEGRELAWRLGQERCGPVIRQEDDFFCWLMALAGVMPPSATYVFVDKYEAGKEIEARYHLTPRRHILVNPKTPPSFLFYALRQEQATFLVIRAADLSLGPGVQAAANSPAFAPVKIEGPGKVFRVDPSRLAGGFYD
jgi:hypothetical protein